MKYFLLLFIVVVLGVTLLYLNSHTYPVEYGISFSHPHAAWLGLDWKQAYRAMLVELKPSFIRISAPWDDTQPAAGQYNFADIDWQMNEAERRGVKVTMVIGQKAPRWPECHVPAWTEGMDDETVKKELLGYVRALVERYKSNPALEYWQVENEPFIRFVFGECKNFHKEFTEAEVALVRSLDPGRKIIITDSGELGFWRKASLTGDILGTTIYRKVRLKNGWVWPYWFMPVIHYRFKAELLGRGVERLFISELQAEPWFHDGHFETATIADMEKTLSPAQLKKNIDYARHIGAPRAYLWGAEWWYWMKTERGDHRYWDLIKDTLNK